MIDLGLTAKRAVVAGAGYRPERAGHGRNSAMQLAAAGAVVACIDIDEGRAKGTVSAIEDAGGKAVSVVADMTVPTEAQRAVDEAAQALGGIDLCVDIIGGARWDQVEERSDDDWDWVLTNNLNHVFYFYRAAAKHMIQQGSGGSLVAITSVDGLVSSPYHASYGAAKAGLISLTKTFAEELGKHGIRANVVAPGNVGGGEDANRPEEGQWAGNEINPLAAPRALDIANAVLFLSSALAARITGQTLVVDGGATIRSPWGAEFLKGHIGYQGYLLRGAT